jgi:hypothetical protein
VFGHRIAIHPLAGQWFALPLPRGTGSDVAACR